MPETPDYEPVTPTAAPRSALLTIFLVVFVDLLGFGIIIPALPIYARSFSASPLEVGLIFSIFSACQFIAAPILGAMSDRYGRRPVLILSQFGSAAGYVLLGMVTHYHWSSAGLALVLLYISRIIDGISGGNISTAQAYIADITTRENRSRGMALLGVAFGLGFTLGPFIGGIFGEKLIYLPAYIAAGLSAVAAVLTMLLLPESRAHNPTEAEVWLHPRSFMPVLRDRVLRPMLFTSFLCMGAFVMMETVLVMFLMDRFNWPLRSASWYMGFLGLIIILVQGGMVHRMARKHGEWPVSLGGLILAIAGMLLYLSNDFWPLLTILFVAGTLNAAGRSFWQPTFQSLVSQFTRPDQQGVVFGLYWGTSSLARVIAPIIAGLIYFKQRTFGPFAAAAVLLAIAAGWTLTIRRKAPEPVEPESQPAPEALERA